MSEIVKILVVEDEFIIASYMEDCLQKSGYHVLATCSNYEEAAGVLADELPDMVLLDINLKGKKTGIDLAQLINEQYQIPFIYVTSLSDKKTVDEAKQTAPYAYLVKPFDEEEIYASIETALVKSAQTKPLTATEQQDTLLIKDVLFIKHRNHFVKLTIADIDYIQADDNYVHIFSKQVSFLQRSTLKDIELQLPNYFCKIHRSYLINLKQVEKFTTDDVYIGGKQLPVAKNFYQNFIEKLGVV
jgi:two-component system, LytTR family, response regulator LytT